jgi:hypothetical protein
LSDKSHAGTSRFVRLNLRRTVSIWKKIRVRNFLKG